MFGGNGPTIKRPAHSAPTWNDYFHVHHFSIGGFVAGHFVYLSGAGCRHRPHTRGHTRQPNRLARLYGAAGHGIAHWLWLNGYCVFLSGSRQQQAASGAANVSLFQAIGSYAAGHGGGTVFYRGIWYSSTSLLPAPDAVLELEKRIDAMLQAATSFTTLWQLAVAAVVMAVVPAIAEELFFRGLVMGDLLRSGVKPATSIVVSGIIFSLVHFEFHNFLAIGVLGIFLGYLYYVSGSLWLCVAAHFINNFFAVLARYMANVGIISPELAEGETPVWLTIAGGVVFLSLAFVIRSFKQPDLLYRGRAGRHRVIHQLKTEL
jgi:membrane protease YdiL (CAAX protease family)